MLRDHDNAEERLARGVENVGQNFDRKYPAELPEIDTDAIAAAIIEGAFGACRPANSRGILAGP